MARLAHTLLCIMATIPALASPVQYSVQPFEITIPPAEVARTMSLARLTRLPAANEFAGGNWSYGISHSALAALRDEWVGPYNWIAEQATLNGFKQYTAEISGLKIHFVHERAVADDAIPIIMLHGWPGSFHEYLPTVSLLTQPAPNKQGSNASFHVVIPSLPGFGFSTLPAQNATGWTVQDTARVFNTLMVDVLGYSKYMLFGSDYGSDVGYTLYSSYSNSVGSALFAFIPFFPPSAAQIAADNVTLDAFEEAGVALTQAWDVSGSAYFNEQRYRPNTIGLALLDNPVGTLAWLAEKFVDWSDPRAGTGPSKLTNTTILTAVSLYVHTRTILSSVWIYAPASNGFLSSYDVDPKPAQPMGMSMFRYNVAQWPRAYAAKVGNLVFYNEHDFGGHFPGLDNPQALVDDIRELSGYFEK